ncbi:MAG: penicillin-insensitive murein endopeptidase [Deltaproteobacteria bacterium]|nr:penicillin-insensitive murein endopeptidase [Deltaproteobacteria bacterium]
MRRAGVLFLFISLLFNGCLPFAIIFQNWSGALGTVSNGILSDSIILNESPEIRFDRKVNRHAGTPQLVEMLKSASLEMDKQFGVKLTVGDMSAPLGGKISGHKSHRTGLDGDIAFFIIDTGKKVINGNLNDKFDRFGVSLNKNGKVMMFDYEKNWALVETLINDTRWRVQWIFVSSGVKSAMLKWALINKKDIDTVYRASYILHQPKGADPHMDHFHVRIYCPQNKTQNGCTQLPPIWPWEKEAEPPPVKKDFTDAELIKMATEGLE